MLVALAVADAAYLTGLTVVICRIREVRWFLRYPSKRGTMETRIMLSMVIPDDTIYGTCRVSVSKWEGAQLVLNSTPYQAAVIIKPIEEGDAVYPYAVAALREGGDNAIAHMLDLMGRGEILVMHHTPEPNF